MLSIHADQIERYGGPFGIRDRGLLESALAMPGATFSGEERHPSLSEEAAADLFHLCIEAERVARSGSFAANLQ